MRYYKSRHSSERFSSPLRQISVVVGGLTCYLPNVHVTKVNNDQLEIK